MKQNKKLVVFFKLDGSFNIKSDTCCICSRRDVESLPFFYRGGIDMIFIYFSLPLMLTFTFCLLGSDFSSKRNRLKCRFRLKNSSTFFNQTFKNTFKTFMAEFFVPLLVYSFNLFQISFFPI